MRQRRSSEPNGVARAFWDEIRTGIIAAPDDDGRSRRRKLPPREVKLRRRASATRHR